MVLHWNCVDCSILSPHLLLVSWWTQWGVMLAACHCCYSWWRWWSDALWLTLIKVTMAIFIFVCVFFFLVCLNWENSHLQQKNCCGWSFLCSLASIVLVVLWQCALLPYGSVFVCLRMPQCDWSFYSCSQYSYITTSLCAQHFSVLAHHVMAFSSVYPKKRRSNSSAFRNWQHLLGSYQLSWQCCCGYFLPSDAKLSWFFQSNSSSPELSLG